MKKLLTTLLTIAVLMVGSIDARGGGGGHGGGGHGGGFHGGGFHGGGFRGGHGFRGGRWGGWGWGGPFIGVGVADYDYGYPYAVDAYTSYPYYDEYIAAYPGAFSVGAYRGWLRTRYPRAYGSFFRR